MARHSVRRPLGLVLVIAGALIAIAAPGAAVATHTEPLPLTLVAANAECQEAGFDFGWKLDNVDQLHAGPYTFSSPDGSVTGSITFTGDDDPDDPNNNQPTGYTNLVVNPEPDEILVKQPNVGGGISHITFCYNEAAATTPPPTTPPPTTPPPTTPPPTTPPPTTPPPTTPPPTTPPPTTPPPTTAPPTGTAVPVTPPPTTAPPTTVVAPGTPTPAGVTPPATDTELPGSNGGTGSPMYVFLGLILGTVGILLLSPVPVRRRD